MKSSNALFKMAFLLCMTLPSQASIVFSTGGGGTGNNILFKCPAGDPLCVTEIADNDQTLFARIGNTDFQTQFDANVNIMPGASGQATIIPVVAGDDWTTLDFAWINFLGTDEVILRIKPVEDDTAIVLSATDQFGVTYSSFPGFGGVPAPQGSFFKLSASDGQLITSVHIAADKRLAEVEQVRLGDIVGGGAEAPEPGTMTLFGAGLLFAGVVWRRRTHA